MAIHHDAYIGGTTGRLMEAKEDLNRFRDWLRKSFMDYYRSGVSDNGGDEDINHMVDHYSSLFLEMKPRLKSPYNDFYYWMRKSTPREFVTYMDRLEGDDFARKETTKRERDGARLVYSDKDWKVYEITTYEASAKYGKGTKWCVTGSRKWANGESGREYFDRYHNDKGIGFYYFIGANGEKYALSIYPDGKHYEIYNAEDLKVPFIPGAPQIDEIPVNYRDNSDTNILIDAIMGRKIGDDNAVFLLKEILDSNSDMYTDAYIYNKPQDIMKFLDENIPDGYLEHQAVENGHMSREEYKRLTGEEYDGDIWGGDLPRISGSEDATDSLNYKSKEELLKPGNFTGYQYWICIVDDYDIRIDGAKDYFDLMQEVGDLCGMDGWEDNDVEAALRANDIDVLDIDPEGLSQVFDVVAVVMAGQLIMDIRRGRLPVGVISNLGLSKDFMDSLNESLTEGVISNIGDNIELVANSLGTTEKPFMGPSYILPDGRFLKIRDADTNITATGSGDRGLVIHQDVIRWIARQRGIPELDATPDLLEEECIRVNTGMLEHYIVLPRKRPTEKALRSLVDWIDFFQENVGGELRLVSYYGPTETFFEGTVAEDVIDDIKSYYARGMFFESLNEYLDEVGSETDYAGYPVYVTDSAYQLRDLISRGDKAYRIFEDEGTYYFQDALGNKTHSDMLNLALSQGWMADSQLRCCGDSDDPTSGYVYPDLEDPGYMVFIPFNYDGKLRYHTKLGRDHYFNCRVYDFGVMFVRNTLAYANGLFEALGEPESEVSYDRQDGIVTVDTGDTTRDFDVYSELNGDPNLAITRGVGDKGPGTGAGASRKAIGERKLELRRECGVPERLMGHTDYNLSLIVLFDRKGIPGNIKVSHEEVEAIARYLDRVDAWGDSTSTGTEDTSTNDMLEGASTCLGEMKSKGTNNDGRVLQYIRECIAEMRKIRFWEDDHVLTYDDIDFEVGDATNTFGTFRFPNTESGRGKLILNKYMFDEPEEAIKNTIYHELCHYVVYKWGVQAGAYINVGPGKWRQDIRDFDRTEWSAHGSRWQEVAGKVSRACNTNITRTGSFQTHTGVGDYRDEKSKYIIRCTHCGALMRYQKLTDFVKAVLYGDGHTENWWHKCSDGTACHDFEMVKGR